LQFTIGPEQPGSAAPRAAHYSGELPKNDAASATVGDGERNHTDAD
jgi:hypothetical protein